MLISKGFWKTLGGLVFSHGWDVCGMFAVALLPSAGLSAAWPAAPAQVPVVAQHCWGLLSGPLVCRPYGQCVQCQILQTIPDPEERWSVDGEKIEGLQSV